MIEIIILGVATMLVFAFGFFVGFRYHHRMLVRFMLEDPSKFSAFCDAVIRENTKEENPIPMVLLESSDGMFFAYEQPSCKFLGQDQNIGQLVQMVMELNKRDVILVAGDQDTSDQLRRLQGG